MSVDDEGQLLPPGLRDRLAGWTSARNLAGMTSASVHRLRCAGHADLFLKSATGPDAATLLAEAARLQWAASVLPVPHIEHLEYQPDAAWLLTTALPGRSAYDWIESDSERGPAIVDALADFLRQLHSLPVEGCPFNAQHPLRMAQARQRIDAGLVDEDDFDDARTGQTAQDVWVELLRLLPFTPDLAVTHGDFSLDNVLLDDACRITGVIDLGRLGVADRYQDLAVLWNCLGEFGLDLQQRMLARYGVPEPDQRKLDFHLCLDELF